MRFARKLCCLPLSLARRPYFWTNTRAAPSSAPLFDKITLASAMNLSNTLLLTHIVAGSITLVTGPFAIFYNFRDLHKHRLVSKVFFWTMPVVAVSAIISYFKHPGEVFYQFLLGISLMVLAGISRGVRSIFLMKGAKVNGFDWAYTGLLGLNAVFMLGMAAWLLGKDATIPFPILFGVFSTMSATDTWTNWKVLHRPESLQRLDWVRLHLGTMLGAFTASTTAFTVNAASFLPWWTQWFGPTASLVPLQFYFGGKIRRMKRAQTTAATP